MWLCSSQRCSGVQTLCRRVPLPQACLVLEQGHCHAGTCLGLTVSEKINYNIQRHSVQLSVSVFEAIVASCISSYRVQYDTDIRATSADTWYCWSDTSASKVTELKSPKAFVAVASVRLRWHLRELTHVSDNCKGTSYYDFNFNFLSRHWPNPYMSTNHCWKSIRCTNDMPEGVGLHYTRIHLQVVVCECLREITLIELGCIPKTGCLLLSQCASLAL